MLNSFRRSANTPFAKFILISIAFAFAVGGVGYAINGRSNFDIVKFKYADNISISDFYKAKNEAIRSIQQNYENVTEEMLEQMNLDHGILESLIRNRLIKDWIDTNGLAANSKKIALYIKKNKRYQDENGNFSLEIFKANLSKLGISEEEFYDNIRFNLLSGLLDQTFRDGAYFPKFASGIIVDYLAEVKHAKYTQINLSERGLLEEVKPSEEDLASYYEENKEAFKTPEQRSVKYLVIDQKTLKNKLSVSNDEIKAYFDENADEFKNIKFADAKQIINKKIKERKTLDVFTEESKKLEDLVASGENIDEIAAKYGKSANSFSGYSEDFEKNKHLAAFSEQIFVMDEKEVSYPSELTENKEIILMEVSSVTEGKIPELSAVKDEVIAEFRKRSYREQNLANIKEIEQKINPDNFVEILNEYGFRVNEVKIDRSSNNTNIPVEVAAQVLNSSEDSVPSPIIFDDECYFVNVSKTQIDKAKVDLIKKEKMASIDENYRISFVEEVIGYF